MTLFEELIYSGLVSKVASNCFDISWMRINFVAEYIFMSIHSEIDLSVEDLAGILGNLLKGNRLSKEICGFLEYKFRNESSFDIAIMVNQAFQLMLRDGMTYYTRMYFKNVIVCELNVFYNMLDIMHLWEKNRLKFDSSICKYLSCNKNFIANLSYADLSDINLVNADLSKADLTGVNLNRSDLRNANLLGTKLYEASLVNAKLNGCNLTEARLMGANLEETEFEDASLKGTVFSEIQINYLEEKYDIRRERAITKETLKLMEDLKRKNYGRNNVILSHSEIDALLEALSSGELDVDEEDMDEKNVVLEQYEIDLLVLGLRCTIARKEGTSIGLSGDKWRVLSQQEIDWLVFGLRYGCEDDKKDSL